MDNNSVMIVTGTSKGIGKYIAEYYLKKEYTVIGCSRGESSLQSSDYFHFMLDVADESAVKKMVNEVRKKFGRVDVLINNAGIASMNHILLTPLSVVEKIFKTNVFGTFLLCREVSRLMISRKKGRIVNLVTVATPLKLDGEAIYAASKAAVKNFTEILAKELAVYNITCNAVGPTPVYTDLIKSVPREKIDRLLDMQTIHRLGEFRDISNVIDFLIKEESDFITGQTIYLGGVS
jgi:3-oxoacyl-[acyl-carrier protein] reductase